MLSKVGIHGPDFGAMRIDDDTSLENDKVTTTDHGVTQDAQDAGSSLEIIFFAIDALQVHVEEGRNLL